MALKRYADWLRAHLMILQYVSLRLLVGFGICVISLRLFAELVEEVFAEQDFARLDLAIANELHKAATPGAIRFFELATAMGFQVIWVIGIGVGLYFLWRRNWLHLTVWVAALAGGEALNFLLKAWFARGRPSFADPLAVALFYSFPSGHAMMSLITYGFIAYLLFITLPRAWERVPVTAGLILLILLIGFSRIYLGVHYLSDILAGFVVGALWLSFCVTAMNVLLERRERRLRESEKTPEQAAS